MPAKQEHLVDQRIVEMAEGKAGAALRYVAQSGGVGVEGGLLRGVDQVAQWQQGQAQAGYVTINRGHQHLGTGVYILYNVLDKF